MNIFEGDPRLILTADGADLEFKGGQPVMDQGLENLALISLFTSKGWAGNVLFDGDDEKIGSDFYKISKQPITITSLNNLRQAAISALQNQAFGEIEAEVTNPNSNRLDVKITIHPPGEDSGEIILLRNGANWVAQKNFPANERI